MFSHFTALILGSPITTSAKPAILAQQLALQAPLGLVRLLVSAHALRHWIRKKVGLGTIKKEVYFVLLVYKCTSQIYIYSSVRGRFTSISGECFQHSEVRRACFWRTPPTVDLAPAIMHHLPQPLPIEATLNGEST